MGKWFICTPIPYVLLYVHCILGDPVKFSEFLSCVEVTTCVKFQIPWYKAFKDGISRIRPIDLGA